MVRITLTVLFLLYIDAFFLITRNKNSDKKDFECLTES